MSTFMRNYLQVVRGDECAEGGVVGRSASVCRGGAGLSQPAAAVAAVAAEEATYGSASGAFVAVGSDVVGTMAGRCPCERGLSSGSHLADEDDVLQLEAVRPS